MMVRTEVDDPQQIGGSGCGSSTLEHYETRIEAIHKSFDSSSLSVGGKHRKVDSSSGRSTRSFRPPMSPKRIDSLNTENTASTAEMSNHSFDSFVLKNSGDSFRSQHEPGSPAAFFQQSYNKIVLDTTLDNDSKLSISNPPLSPSGGVSYIQESPIKLQKNQKSDNVIGKEVSAVSVATSTVESFRDSYRKQLEKKLHGDKDKESSSVVPETSSGASFFEDSYRKLEKKQYDVAREDDEEEATSTGAACASLKLEMKENAKKVEEPEPTSDTGLEDSYRKYFEDACQELEKQSSDQHEEEPAPAGASFFEDSYSRIVHEKKKDDATMSLPSRSPSKRCQHVVSDSKLVLERGYSAYAKRLPPQPQHGVSDSNLVVGCSSSDVLDTSSAPDPYLQLKRFMCEGMGKVSDDRAQSMAENRLSLARQASRRASIGKVGSNPISRKFSEHLKRAAKDYGGMDSSGHSIDMAGQVESISPPRSPTSVDRPTGMGPIPVMEEDSPSRGEPSQELHPSNSLPQHQDIEIVNGLPAIRTADAQSSVRAAELFAQFHATKLDSRADVKPGAYTAEGPPTGDLPQQWSSETSERLQPPQRSQWSRRQRSSRRPSNFAIWWGLSQFSRRSMLRGGEASQDFPTGPLQTEEVSRRTFFRRSRSSSQRLVGLRVTKSEQDDVAERTNIPPELPPIPGTLGDTMLIPDPLADPHTMPRSLEAAEGRRKKPFRRTRKAFSKFCECLQHCINVFVSYT